MTGFVAAYRDSLDHPLFKGNADKLGAWMWLLMSAAWKQTKFDVNGKVVKVERGQVSVSIRHLAEAWGWSKSTTERFLTRLKTETMIETDNGTGRLLITICNYDKYQGISEKSGTAVGTKFGTAAGQQRDIKEQGNKGTRDNTDVLSQREDAQEDTPELPFVADEAAAVAKPKAKGSRKSPPFDEATFELPDDIPAEEWAEFVAMRRDTGRRIKTVQGANGLINQLRQLAEDGHPPGQVLRQSIACEYQGIFPITTGRISNGNGNHHNKSEQSHGLAEAIAERRSGRAGEQPQFL